jgi:pimeloyl-ACP methyl ester carboxylesterase
MVNQPFTAMAFERPGGIALSADVGGYVGAPAVVLLHGGGQTRRSWSGAAKALAANGYYVINLDARGHGDSDWAADGRYTLDVLATDVSAVLAQVPGPFALVGASMGGVTALHLAASGAAPDVAALVMVDIVPRIEQAGSDRIRTFMRSNPNGFASLEEASEAVASYYPLRPRPRDPTGLKANLRLRDDGRLHWHWDPRLIHGEHALEPPAFSDALLSASRRVNIPVMLVRGLRSDIVSDAGVEEFRGVIPHLEVFEVSQAGHMVAGDKNDAFNAGVLGFLGRHFPARGI